MYIVGGRILTMAGREIPEGILQIRNGKIAQVGARGEVKLQPEEGEQVVIAKNALIMPGIIEAHCHMGIMEEKKSTEGDDCNETVDPLTPALRAIDGINPMDAAFDDAVRAGITAAMIGPGSSNVVGGQFAMVKTKGRRIDDLILKSPAAMKVAFGENPKVNYSGQNKSPVTRMAIAAMLRRELWESREYLRQKQEAAEKGEYFAPDFEKECYLPVLRGDIPLKAHVHRVDDIFTAIRIAKEFGIKMTMDHCSEGHLVAEELEYSQSHIEPVKQKTAEGHAVRAMYMCSAMADLAVECEDTEMLEACKRLWDSTVNHRMYLTGGIGSSGFRERFTTDYDLPNTTNYSETCASIGLMMFGQRMSAATGEAGYYDTVELALYNTVLAGINRAGDRYFYVNPLEVVPEFCTEHTYMDHVKAVRQKWFSVACCPPNVARTLASLGQYIYAQEENAVCIHQFISSTAKAVLESGTVEIGMESTLLQDSKVKIQTRQDSEVTFKIRRPGYAGKQEITVDGQTAKAVLEKGYLLINTPAGEHEICIDFGVKPRWIAANDEVRADAGRCALMNGPVVYCLEETDNGKYLADLYVEENTEVTKGNPQTDLPGEIPTLQYEATRIHNRSTEQGNLYGELKLEKEQMHLTAVPYGLWCNRTPGEMLVWVKVKV